jgi:hypothetical protein
MTIALNPLSENAHFSISLNDESDSNVIETRDLRSGKQPGPITSPDDEIYGIIETVHCVYGTRRLLTLEIWPSFVSEQIRRDIQADAPCRFLRRHSGLSVCPVVIMEERLVDETHEPVHRYCASLFAHVFPAPV